MSSTYNINLYNGSGKKGKTMSKLSNPLDIPLRGSKKSFVGIGQNILSDEENSVELVVGKPVIYSKSVKKEIEIDAIYSLSPELLSNVVYEKN